MKTFNDRQTELAIALREMIKTPEGVAWGDFTDFSRSLAKLLEGAESLARPVEMRKRFSHAWKTFAKLGTNEHQRIVRDVLGEDYDEVVNHPNSMNIVGRVMGRVTDTCGPLFPDIVVENVNVDDILAEELGEEQDYG